MSWTLSNRACASSSSHQGLTDAPAPGPRQDKHAVDKPLVRFLRASLCGEADNAQNPADIPGHEDGILLDPGLEPVHRLRQFLREAGRKAVLVKAEGGQADVPENVTFARCQAMNGKAHVAHRPDPFVLQQTAP